MLFVVEIIEKKLLQTLLLYNKTLQACKETFSLQQFVYVTIVYLMSNNYYLHREFHNERTIK